MFEEYLECIAPKTITSLTENMFVTLENIITDSNDLDTFDAMYEKIIQFFTSDCLKYFYDTVSRIRINKELEVMKPTVALYCCYFAMDYVYRMEHPTGEQLDFSFIKDFYDCDSDNAREIYNLLRTSSKKTEKIKVFEDTMYVNPGGYIEKMGKNYSKAHIYLGNIKKYLDKSCEVKEGKLILHDLVPSITFIALRSIGSLPNGGDTNKSRNKISGNIINSIDRWILGKTIVDKLDIETFKRNKIKYSTKPEIAELINLAAVDDVYRMDRLNMALHEYVHYLEQKKDSNDLSVISKVDEYTIAGICSLLISIPISESSRYLDPLEQVLDLLEYGSSRIPAAYANQLFAFTSVTFPYLIGISCYLLFYKSGNIKSIEEIKKIIQNLEECLLDNYDTLKEVLNIDKNRIWPGEHSTSTKYTSTTGKNKGTTNKKKINKNIDWSAEHFKPFNEIAEIMLSPTHNIMKTRTLVDENFTRVPTTDIQRQIRARSFGSMSLIPTRPGASEMIRPEAYSIELAFKFVETLLGIN
ncbi:hypothetical protein AALB39_25900 [Lachnospiraceae bacterium 54-53]